jgi:hypothetical protein
VSPRAVYGLQGDLRCFPPDLVFQMMAFGQLEGLLTLRGPAGKCRVYFKDGRLIFARGPQQKERLGEELVRRGLLDRRVCEEALREVRRSKGERRLGTVLVERGYVSRADLEEHIRARIKDAIYEVVEWRDGRFTFQPGVQPESEDILLDVGLDSVLLECMTRRDDARHALKDEPGNARGAGRAPAEAGERRG